ncbi:MAG: NAD(P)/FAD-dependent oxidoreductase [Parvibaculaceae bacterium]
MTKHDVIVVGAGIAGASTAFFLAERGVDVGLVEMEHPASGPTGRSSAVTHAFYLQSELSRLAIAGVSTLRRLPELTGEAKVHTECGMMWACGADAAPAWRAIAERITGEGSKIEALAPDDLARRAPGIDLDGIALALWEEDYGYGDPYGATQALVKGARQRGATVYLNSKVDRLVQSSGRIAGVETARQGRLAAPVVVSAAGVWTKPLIGALGYDLPIHVERHIMAVLDGQGRAHDVMPFSWCDDLLCNYARPDGDRVILCGVWAGGGTGIRHQTIARPEIIADPDHYRADTDESECIDALSFLLPRFPRLAELGVRPGYAGLYDMSPDDNPLIGPVPGIDGLFAICGSSGHGFKLGAGVGEEVARLVTEGRSELLAPFSLDRFTDRRRGG